jgi:large subunit ribosomal protein L5
MTTELAAPTVPRLKQRYSDEIRAQLQDELHLANVMQVPGLVKIVVNMGVGDAARDSKLIDGAVKDLAIITGQKPTVTKARKSIAQFKLREGQPIGAHTTLRGDRMWEFLDRLLSVSLPRIRDFRGLSPKQFDGNGNYTFGLTEQATFAAFAEWTSRSSPRPSTTTLAARCLQRWASHSRPLRHQGDLTRWQKLLS